MPELLWNPAEIRKLSKELEIASTEEVLEWCWNRFGGRAALGTSFQGAGLILIHLSRSLGCNFPVFTIDTGLLFPETLKLKAELEGRYGLSIESLTPEQTVEEQARELEPGLWNTKPDLCCTLRKVLPLQKKLSQLDVWITGIRREQSAERSKAEILELYHFDIMMDRFILKLNPLANWTRGQVQEFLKDHGIPINPLAAQGYRSIGCQPCTQPVHQGDSERAGRWTGFNKTECGIHTFLGSKNV